MGLVGKSSGEINMHTQAAKSIVDRLTAIALAAAILVGVVAVLGIGCWSQQASEVSGRFEYDLEKLQRIDPALIQYRQTGEIFPGMQVVRALAVGPEDRVYVAGDRVIRVFGPAGEGLTEITLEDQPQCLAVAGAEDAFPGRVYVGMKTHVEVYGADGKRKTVWDDLGEKAVLTSIAVGQAEVFVADAGNRIVLRYDTGGVLKGRIGQRDEGRDNPGFVVPSPYFDLAMAPDGVLRVVNPGGHRVEAYTADGERLVSWGKPTAAIEGFCGCCNPVNIAILSDGRFVTAEKGIPRVKIYSAEGRFESVVAGPQTLAPTPSAAEETRSQHKLLAVDVATDSRGRVLVLDPSAGRVRVFEHQNPQSGREK